MNPYQDSGTKGQVEMTGFKGSQKTRKRDWLIHSHSVGHQTSGNPPSEFTSDIRGRQETTSEGHQWPPRKRIPNDFPLAGLARLDSGGPFLTRRNYVTQIESADVYATGGGGIPAGYNYAFVKGIVPAPGIGTSILLPATSSSTLTSEGTRALNQMRPTAPLSGLGVTLGELREGLPSLIGSGLLKALMSDAKRQRRFLKAGSDEYLNWEFGWKPLVSDLRDASKAVLQSKKIIDQLYRDSGKDVRRRFGYPVSKDTSTASATSYGYPGGITYLYDAPGKLYTTVENHRRVWISGMCRYYVPPMDDLHGRIARQAQEANRLLGMRPDPELLWQLAPWTWLVDWVSDVGSLVGNFTSFAFDGLVWKYAYLMEHKIERTRYDLVGLRLYNGSSPRIAATRIRESKNRVSASPFGFGLSLDSFSLRQWSILAALGISRGNL